MTLKDETENALALELFLKVGLDERTAKNTVANGKVTSILVEAIRGAEVTDGCERTIRNLIYIVATKFPKNALMHRPTVFKYVVSSKIKTSAQLEAAIEHLGVTDPNEFDLAVFEKACGVGVVVSTEEIEVAVNEIFDSRKNEIFEQRYRIKDGHSDPKLIKEHAEAKLYELLGDKTAADYEKPKKEKKKRNPHWLFLQGKKVSAEVAPLEPSEEELNPFLNFLQPEENFKVHTEIFFSDRSVLRACNTEILDKHLKKKGGKAMFVSFGLAKERNGHCYLRYDDTNPEAQKKEYIDHIEEIVSWMGWEPYKITYISDYFQEIHDLAVELIRRDCASVDHQVRNFFDEMKQGKIEEGNIKATLRMKQDMQSDNFNMYDLIAYGIKYTPHPHAGAKWCIYPSYDYARCVVGSLENITHSIKIETRRWSYYRLLDALSIYQPYVWEYSRLNNTNTVMSKHKDTYFTKSSLFTNKMYIELNMFRSSMMNWV
uniref:Glutaminyl-tRNA synthetase n=1 Tax=Kalanchoe fedtschenkoi TaxID=63787 RepID=A0A7N0V496_KALFE